MIEKINYVFFELNPSLAPVYIALLILLTGFVTYKMHALTFGGAVSASVLGFCVTWSLYFEGLFVFLFFFVVASLAGKIKRKNPSSFKEEKSGARDYIQVTANGLLAAVAGLLWYCSASPVALIMFASSVSESFSDTLAGDLGHLSVHIPVSILTGRPVEKGESGGVTALGFFAGFCASAIIALIWKIAFHISSVKYTLIVCICGFTGCIVDSLLGASVQAIYKNEKGQRTEKPFDTEGKPNVLVRGIRAVNNDTVNFISNFLSVVFASLLYLIFE